MLRRGLGIALASMLVVTGVGLVGVSTRSQPDRVTLARTHPRFDCHGISRRQVRGQRPTYTHKRLAAFPNHHRLCTGWWLPRPRTRYVPQGIVVDGRTAWVSGFRYERGYGERACKLIRMDLRTGQRMDGHALVGRIGKRPTTYCRHGGGIAQTRSGRLWVVQRSKLWVFRSDDPKGTMFARRGWRLQPPVYGSSVVVKDHRIGLVPFEVSGPAHIYWFDFRKLHRPGVLELGARPGKGVDVVAAASTRIPTHVQGAAVGPNGRLYLTRSGLSCGELVTPRRRIAFVPGAEGIQFSATGKRLFAVSESGAVPYAHSRRPLTPAISKFEWPGLLHGKRSRCNFH